MGSNLINFSLSIAKLGFIRVPDKPYYMDTDFCFKGRRLPEKKGVSDEQESRDDTSSCNNRLDRVSEALNSTVSKPSS